MSEGRPPASLSHEEAATELPAAALGALAPAELAAVLAHVDRCDPCAAELASLRAVAGRLDETRPAAAAAIDGADHERAAARRRRLVDRARAERSAAGATEVGPPLPVVSELPASSRRPGATPPATERVIVPAAARRRGRQAHPWLAPMAALAATAAFVATGIGLLSAREELRQLRATVSIEDRAHAAELALLRDQVRDRDDQMARLTGPSVQVVELASSRNASPRMRVFWDRATNSWTLVGHRVPVLPDGRTYQLWLVAGGRTLSAGTFVPTRAGDALYRTTYRLDGAPLTGVAVTVEPEGGVPVATGPVVMLGAVSRGS